LCGSELVCQSEKLGGNGERPLLGHRWALDQQLETGPAEAENTRRQPVVPFSPQRDELFTRIEALYSTRVEVRILAQDSKDLVWDELWAELAPLSALRLTQM
jgi:hypothetical protein